MKHNQFFDAGKHMLEIKAETKRKSAYIKIGIPDELATQLMTQITTGAPLYIYGLQLAYHDSRIEDED